MIKRIIFSCILLSLSFYSYAQDFKAGLIAGFNTAQLNGDLMGGFHKTSLAGGLFVNYEISKLWTAQMEMVYSRKGSRRVFGDGVVQSGPWDKARLNYIEVPLLAGYRYKKRLMIQAGGSAGYLINTSIDYGGGFINVDSAFKKYEIAYLIGAELRISKKYSINARFSQSALSISPGNPNTILSLRPGYINMLLQFTLRIKFQE